jgi:hypothetical protein
MITWAQRLRDGVAEWMKAPAVRGVMEDVGRAADAFHEWRQSSAGREVTDGVARLGAELQEWSKTPAFQRFAAEAAAFSEASRTPEFQRLIERLERAEELGTTPLVTNGLRPDSDLRIDSVNLKVDRMLGLPGLDLDVGLDLADPLKWMKDLDLKVLTEPPGLKRMRELDEKLLGEPPALKRMRELDERVFGEPLPSVPFVAEYSHVARHIRARTRLLQGDHRPNPGEYPDRPLCGLQGVGEFDMDPDGTEAAKAAKQYRTHVCAECLAEEQREQAIHNHGIT